MPRLARAVAPGHPHHVTQRGNRRQRTFFSDDDYRLYLHHLAEQTARARVAVWGYCLMPNHAHLILTPADEPGLAQAVGETHRRYTWIVNQREGWTGHLWQGRFGSAALDEQHFLEAVRYLALNPVRAGLALHAEDWPWSSARAHAAGRGDGIVDVAPLLERIGSWDKFIEAAMSREAVERIRAGDRTGRPVGSDPFIERVGLELGRTLARQKRGRKPGPNRRAAFGVQG
jgi:putative transposase